MPTHAEQRHLPYTPDQLFDLVADIEKYPEFLPWAVGARIKRREENVLYADLMIGFKMLREKYTSKVTLDHDNMVIDVENTTGPFKYLNNHWKFLEADDGGVIIDFYVDFEFKNRMLQSMMTSLFNEAVQMMVRAFEKRAHELYGEPA